MEKQIRALLDFQRFAQNGRLQDIIDAAQARHPLEKNRISDDLLELNAAGDIHVQKAEGPDEHA